MKKFTIDDLLLVAFLALTVWHTAHVLAAFEIIGWLAWPLAFGIDVGVARAAWVASGRNLSKGARIVAGLWLAYLLIASFGLNCAYYIERGGLGWSWALASLFPVSLAAVGGIKSFLMELPKQEVSRETETPTPAQPKAIVTSAADSSTPQDEPSEIKAVLEETKELVLVAGGVDSKPDLRQTEPSRQTAICQLRDTGKTWKEIAYVFGISESMARHIAKNGDTDARKIPKTRLV